MKREDEKQLSSEPEILAAATIYQCTELFEPIRNNGAYKKPIDIIRRRMREMEDTIKFDQGARSLRDI